MTAVTQLMFHKHSKKLPWHVLAALAYSESTFNANAESNVGAQGLMQFMPATWQQWGPDGTEPWNPEASIAAADAYVGFLKGQLDDNLHTALVAYMWGIGNVLNKGVQNAPEIVRDRAWKIIFLSEALKEWSNLERNEFYTEATS